MLVLQAACQTYHCLAFVIRSMEGASEAVTHTHRLHRNATCQPSTTLLTPSPLDVDIVIPAQ